MSPCMRVLKLATLIYRRRWGDAILVHKLINSKAVPDLLPLASQDSHTRGHNLQLFRHFSSKRQCAHFLTNRVVNLWNKLLPDTVAAQTTYSFKNHPDNEWSTKEWKYNWEELKSATSNYYNYILMTYKLICNHDIISNIFQMDSFSRTRD